MENKIKLGMDDPCDCNDKQSAYDVIESELVKMLEITLGSQHLVKACLDHFDYAIKLRTGEVIRFHEAKVLNKEWLHLNLCNLASDQPAENRLPYPAERGIDVRIADIVWVMDAPEGS